MTALSQSLRRLSIQLPIALALAASAGPALAGGGPDKASPLYGRWTVSEDRPVFTTRGRLYKTIDVAPCGRDFCGVSVGDKGACGPVLFRFLGKSASGDDVLRGHGRWGAEKKNIVIYPGEDNLELYLGDGYSFGERSGSMPKFHADYKRLAGARCVAKG